MHIGVLANRACAQIIQGASYKYASTMNAWEFFYAHILYLFIIV